MTDTPDLQALIDECVELRHHLHSHPEVGLDVVNTLALVKKKLDEFGIDYKPCGVNSLVATIEGTSSGKTIAFRVDMDALPMQEETDLAYKSLIDGKMHACGHDGHCVSLLAFAGYLARNRDFNGTVLLLFQSGEEGYEGALKVIESGFFETHSIDAMFGYHAMPGVETGKIVVHRGACMSSEDRFEITVTGASGHASTPHLCNEPYAAVADIIKGMQSIIVRKVPSHERGVISVTQVHGGSLPNGIPDTVLVQGNVRTNNGAVQDMIEENIGRVAEGAGVMYDLTTRLDYVRKHPVLVNTEYESTIRAAIKAVGEDNVITDMESSMAAEDFAFFMEHVPGCYVWIGNGTDSPPLHSSRFNYDDTILPVVVKFFASVVKEWL